MTEQDHKRRILIAGAGVAGLSAALALDDACEGRIRIAVVDPALDGRRAQNRAHNRAWAIAAHARRLYARLGVWDRLVPFAQPIRSMIVTDSRVADVVRPVYLTFDGAVDGARQGRDESDEAGEPFAHMVEGGPLVAVLTEAARARGLALIADRLDGFTTRPGQIVARLAQAGRLEAELLVGADGARSAVRESAGVGWVGWRYGQTGIVATVAHEADHDGRAEEHFLPSGPFAILPLVGRRSSIVWTEPDADARALIGLDRDDQREELIRRFGRRHGEITLETPLAGHPLGFGVARSFIADRLALIGDAAHVIHPIAGQGLNLGLADVAALAESVGEAVAAGLDAGSAEALEPYQRARRFETMAMGVVTDGLNRLFSNDLTIARFARDLGLGVVDRLPGLKRFFIRRAAGV